MFFCLSSSSQDIERQKAGWIYLLANNISWPGSPEEYVIKVVTEDRQLAVAIKEMTMKRQINDRPITVSFSNFVSIPKDLHILYVTEQYKEALQEIIDQIGNQPVLIITEKSSDLQYLMINLVDTPEGMSFQYNRANMINQGLRIGSDFGELGGDEVNVARLYQQAKSSIQEIEEKSSQIREQMDTLNILTAVAVKLGRTLLTRADETKAQIDFQNKVLEDLRVVLKERERQLAEIGKEIEAKKKQIRLGKVQLEAQSKEIAQQDEVIVGKNNELSELERTSNYQLEILIFLVAFALLFLLALFLAYKAYKARRKAAKKLNEQKEELDELLSQLRAKQKQLIHAEKLSAVGEISDNIAHDVNNASNYILSGIHVIDRKFNDYKQLMSNISSLEENESHLKTKMKVREINVLKNEIEYSSYEAVTENMISSVEAGVQRIVQVLEGLEPYVKYGELGKFGLTILGREAENNQYE